MKSPKSALVLGVFALLVFFIWAPSFLSPALNVETSELPITPAIQLRLNLLATSGLVLLVGIFFWIHRSRK